MTKKILTAQENINRLPERCFGTLMIDNSLIQIVAGETGYYPLDVDFVQRGLVLHKCITTDELADLLNQDIGISKRERCAMEWGSQFGYGTGLAMPERYNDDGTIIKEEQEVVT
jgi:hypothetical protein